MIETLQRMAREPQATATAYRVVIEVYTRGGVGSEWTSTLPTRDLAGDLQAGQETVARAIRWLVSRSYLQRSYSPGPRGGRVPRYRIGRGPRL